MDSPDENQYWLYDEATAILASRRPREVKEITVSNWLTPRNMEEADTLHALNLRTTDTDACQTSSFLEKHEKAWLPHKTQMWGGSAGRYYSRLGQKAWWTRGNVQPHEARCG